MINFFVLNGENKRSCTATDAHKAAQILSLVFPQNRAYVIENNSVVFAQNMSIEEAQIAAGLKPLSIEVLPAPKAVAVKPKKKSLKAKKTTFKSKTKVVFKAKKKVVAKKTVVKSKVKPKTKAKKPVAKSKGNKKKKR